MHEQNALIPIETLQIDRLDLSSWLSAQEHFPKLYWKCRKTGLETVALGSLANFSKVPEIPANLPDSYKLYGALSFSDKPLNGIWKDFAPCFFFLPQIQIFQSSLKTTLQLRGAPISLKKPSKLQDASFLGIKKHSPNELEWNHSIETIVKAIESKQMAKVVLARKSLFQIKGDPFSWLSQLIKDAALNSTVFAFQTSPSSLFLGTSPEMLYEKKEALFFTESLAGTRRRGTSLKEDQILAEELLNSIKDNKEFSFVKNFLQKILPSFCETFSYDSSNSLVQTSKVQHLYNRFEGILKPNVKDSTILSVLHPTPAIGGFPQKEALSMINFLEPFDRGLYSGVIGSISPKESSFAVAIRSALLEKDLLHAFAGTGIVEGSIPGKEWNELNDKIAHWIPL